MSGIESMVAERKVKLRTILHYYILIRIENSAELKHDGKD
jgi:hypothetical protein